MLPYFAFIEYPCPAYKNPSDYYRESTAQKPKTDTKPRMYLFIYLLGKVVGDVDYCEYPPAVKYIMSLCHALVMNQRVTGSWELYYQN